MVKGYYSILLISGSKMRPEKTIANQVHMHKIPVEELARSKTMTWLTLPGLKQAPFAQAAIHRDRDASSYRLKADHSHRLARRHHLK